MLELWGMWSISLLPSLTGPLSPVLIAADSLQSMNQIELFDIETVYKQITYAKVNHWE